MADENVKTDEQVQEEEKKETGADEQPKRNREMETKAALAAEKRMKEQYEPKIVELEAKIAEMEKKSLAQLTDEEKEKKLYEQNMAELEALKQKDAINTALDQARGVLKEKGLPLDSATFLVDLDSEKALSNINSFEEFFNAAVQVQVEERLKTKTPGSFKGQDGNETLDLGKLR